MKTITKHVTFAVLVISGGIAQAQAPDQPSEPATPDDEEACPGEEPAASCPPPQPAPPPPAPVVETNIYTAPAEPVDDRSWFERQGMAITLGGGVSGFTDSDMDDIGGVGGNWDVRVSWGTKAYLGFEASYIGSAQGVDAFGLDTDAYLVGNGLQGALRLNVLPHYAAQPFIYGGLAWRNYQLTNDDFNTSDVLGEDDVMEVPMGIGLAYKYQGFVIDGRAEFRYTTFADLVPSEIGDINYDMNRWGVNANIGYEF